MEDSPEAVRRSFWAAALCLPGFLALTLLDWADNGIPAGGALRGLVAELIGYAVAWVAFALVSLPLAERLGRRAEWPRFIAAWNWANVVQYAVLLALKAPVLLGLPAILGHGLGLAAFGYALWLEWYVARVALRVSAPAAAGFVAVDFVLGIFVGGLAGQLSGAG